MSWLADQHSPLPISKPIDMTDMARLIAWKRRNATWTAIEAEGLDPARIHFAGWLVASGRIGEAVRS